MDPRMFDTMARSLAAPTTRRGLLVSLGAVLAGVRAASAQDGCPPGQTANRKGDCGCRPGTDACPDGCFDRNRDPNNCGQCGAVCPPGAVCSKGECRCPRGAACDPGATTTAAPTTTTTTSTTTTSTTSTTTAAPTTTTAAPTTTTAAPTTTSTIAPTTTTTSTTTSTIAPTTTTTSTTTLAPGTVVAGELAAGDAIVGPTTCGGIQYRYDLHTFTHAGGALSLAVRGASSGGGTLPDPYIFLFTGASLPGNPCVEFLAADDQGGCGDDAYLETTQPAGTYTAMVIEYTNRLGTYTFERNTFTGTNVCP